MRLTGQMRSLMSPQRTGLRILIKVRFSPPLYFGHGSTLLHLTSRGGYAEFARVLFEHGADMNARHYGKLTPLHIALKGGHVEIARLLVKHDPDLNATSVPFRRRPTVL